MKLNPLLAFLKTHLYLVSGRLHFPQERAGEMLTMEDGQTFVIFRQVVLKPGRDQKVEARSCLSRAVSCCQHVCKAKQAFLAFANPAVHRAPWLSI